MVFKLPRIRLRNNLFVLFTLLALLFLVLISPVASNLVEAISFRYAESTENFRTDYSDGSGETNIKKSKPNNVKSTNKLFLNLILGNLKTIQF